MQGTAAGMVTLIMTKGHGRPREATEGQHMLKSHPILVASEQMLPHIISKRRPQDRWPWHRYGLL